MPEVLRSAAEVTPEWLTETLRRRGVLTRGRVSAVRLKSSHALIVSNVHFLEADYTPDAPPTAPLELFLKLSQPDFQPEAMRERSRKEFEFYTSIAGEMKDPPIPRSYDAAFSTETDASHLLLEDLSQTHTQPLAPMPPAVEQCEAAVDCLARLHAHWWEHPRLGAGVGELLSESAVEAMAHGTSEKFARFADFLGDGLSPARRALYETVMRCFPAPWRRLSSAKGLTLTHGDAHAWNFMYPREGQPGRTLLIDWQLWHPHIGPRDLAFMITLNWYPERRARLEEKLLRRYHQGLLAGGVESYGWDACLTDYRWSALRNLFIPVWRWAAGMPPAQWWSSMERAVLAFEDLRGIELIES